MGSCSREIPEIRNAADVLRRFKREMVAPRSGFRGNPPDHIYEKTMVSGIPVFRESRKSGRFY